MKIAFLSYRFKDIDGFIRTARLNCIFLLDSEKLQALKKIREEYETLYSDIAEIEEVGVEDLEFNIMKVI